MELLSPVEAGIELDVDEDGATYAENARKVAQSIHAAGGVRGAADRIEKISAARAGTA